MTSTNDYSISSPTPSSIIANDDSFSSSTPISITPTDHQIEKITSLLSVPNFANDVKLNIDQSGQHNKEKWLDHVSHLFVYPVHMWPIVTQIDSSFLGPADRALVSKYCTFMLIVLRASVSDELKSSFADCLTVNSFLAKAETLCSRRFLFSQAALFEKLHSMSIEQENVRAFHTALTKQLCDIELAGVSIPLLHRKLLVTSQLMKVTRLQYMMIDFNKLGNADVTWEEMLVQAATHLDRSFTTRHSSNALVATSEFAIPSSSSCPLPVALAAASLAYAGEPAPDHPLCHFCVAFNMRAKVENRKTRRQMTHNPSRCFTQYPHLRPPPRHSTQAASSSPSPILQAQSSSLQRKHHASMSFRVLSSSTTAPPIIHSALIAGEPSHSTTLSSSPPTFFLDSGASCHFVNNPSYLKNKRALIPPELVHIGKGTLEATHEGECDTVFTKSDGSTLHLSFTALLVPLLTFNLISVGSLLASGNKLHSEGTSMIISSKASTPLLIATLSVDGMYRLNLSIKDRCPSFSSYSMSHFTLISRKSQRTLAELWHERMGHLNYSYLEILRQHATGMPSQKLVPENKPFCTACNKGKQKRHSFSSVKPHTSTAPLDLISTDLTGPFPSSLGGKKYMITFIDQFTSRAEAHFIAKKSDAFEAFVSYKNSAELKHNRKIKRLRSDRGGEFVSNTWDALMQSSGIAHEMAPADSPQANGKAERFMRIIVEGARTILIAAGLSHGFWAEAMAYIIYTRNRSPHSAIAMRTPFELWEGRLPDLSHMHAFGTPVTVMLTEAQRGSKLNAKAEDGLFIGYDDEPKSYRIWVPARHRVVISRNVEFNEHAVASPDNFNDSSFTSISNETSLLPLPLDLISTAENDTALRDETYNNKANDKSALNNNEMHGDNNERMENDNIEIRNDSDQRMSIDHDCDDIEDEADEAEPEPKEEAAANSTEPPPPPTLPALVQAPRLSSRSATGGHFLRSNPLPVAKYGFDETSISQSAAVSNLTLNSSSSFDSSQQGTCTRPRHSAFTAFSKNDERWNTRAKQWIHAVLSAGHAPTLSIDLSSTTSSSSPCGLLNNIALAAAVIEAASMDLSKEPRSMREARSRPDALQWETAANKELDAFDRLEVFELCELPIGEHAIGSTVVFKIKRNADGSIACYKVRVVAQGFSQIPGRDFDGTFAPTVKMSSIRTLLAMAAIEDWEIHQCDIENAYLNGKLDRAVYMKQPIGLAKPNTEHLVMKLKKGVYGLRQAGRIWFQTMSEALKQLNFVPLASDPCIFKRTDSISGTSLILALFVDDCLILSKCLMEIVKFKRELSSTFKTKDMGEAHFFLGLQLERDRAHRTIRLHQTNYATSLIERNQFQNSKPVATPMAKIDNSISSVMAEEKIDLIEEINNSLPSIEPSHFPVEVNCLSDLHLEYTTIIGQIMYLMICTRPDLAFATCYLAQFSANPTESHIVAVKRLLRFINATKSRCLVIDGKQKDDFVAYCDSDWGGNIQSRSTTGYCIIFAGFALLYRSHRQHAVATSSSQAEYQASSEVAKEIIWLRVLLQELGRNIDSPTTLYGDNQGAIALALNPEFHSRTKHIRIQYHFVRQCIDEKEIMILYLPTELMIADIFTKPLGRVRHQGLCNALGLRDISVVSNELISLHQSYSSRIAKSKHTFTHHHNTFRLSSPD